MSLLDNIFGTQNTPASPTGVQTNVTSLPDYSLPYFQGVLQQGAALTDVNTNPYQPYAGQQTAGLSPLQNQAMGSLGGMQVPGQTGAATGMAQDVFNRSQQPLYNAPQFQSMGLGALNVNAPSLQNFSMQQPGNVSTGAFTDPGQASAYMNPYFQNVVDFQEQEAARQSALQGQQLDSQAIQAGAFGGSRAALQQSERLRNLATQQGGIAAMGAQNAYNAAQQAYQNDQARQLAALQGNQQIGFQTGAQNLGAQLQTQQLGAQTGLTAQQLNQQAQLASQGQGLQQNLAGNQQALANAQNAAQFGIQGLNAGLGAAYTMGNLGQQQVGQQLGIAGAQLGAGQTQQQTEQAALSAQYQNYLNSLNYPYQQLQFMNQLIQGGGGSAAQQQLFQAPPNILSQLAGVGLGGLALSKLTGP